MSDSRAAGVMVQHVDAMHAGSRSVPESALVTASRLLESGPSHDHLLGDNKLSRNVVLLLSPQLAVRPRVCFVEWNQMQLLLRWNVSSASQRHQLYRLQAGIFQPGGSYRVTNARLLFEVKV